MIIGNHIVHGVVGQINKQGIVKMKLEHWMLLGVVLYLLSNEKVLLGVKGRMGLGKVAANKDDPYVGEPFGSVIG
jgi:hypothetical protein